MTPRRPRPSRRPLRRLAPALLLLPACIVVPGGDDDDEGGGVGGPRACTEKGCQDGFTIALASRSGAWAPGAYRFVIEADGATVTCDATLPLPPCEQAQPGRCSAPEVELATGGCGLPPAQHDVSALELRSRPTSVSVTLTRDGVPLTNARLNPTYQELRPNGPGCGPVCFYDAARIEVP
jgi:hypothetical protein